MSNVQLKLAALAAAAVCSWPMQAARAADKMAADKSDDLNDVIVTATRYPVASERVLSSAFVISREEIERTLPLDLADLLRMRSGVEIGRTGGPGQTTSFFLRGTESNHTLVLLNGVRLNPGTIGSAAIQNVLPELAERVEVVKGPLSSIYGTDAIGGVINIITRDSNSTGFSGSAQYGRYDTRTAALSGSFAGDAGHVGLTVAKLETDGFPPQSTNAGGGAFDNLTFALNGGTRIGEVQLGANFWRAAGSVDYIGFSSRNFANSVTTQDYMNTAASAFARYSPTQAWDSKLTLSRMVDDMQQGRVVDGATPNGFYESQDFAHTRRYTADWQNDVKLGEAQVLTLGAIVAREATSAVSFGTAFDVDTDINTFYVQDQLHSGPHDAVAAVGFTDHSTAGNKLTWNLQYGYEFPTDTRINGSFGTAFRAPDATDRFGFGGNPNLKPEFSRNLELGVRQKLDAHQQVTLAAFRTDIDDLIDYVTTNFVTFEGENRNVDKARIKGLELAYELSFDSWSARAGATFQDPVDRETDQQLLRRAKHNYTAALARNFGRWQIGADALHAGKRFDAGFPSRVELDEYTLVNLSVGVHLMDELVVQARLDNAFDEKYQLANTYNTPGRSVMVAIRYSPRGR